MSQKKDDNKKDDRRVRVTRACEPCKVARRKCTGDVPCSYCIKRRIECHFSAEEPKKRGPRTMKSSSSSSSSTLLSDNRVVKEELARLNMQSSTHADAPASAAPPASVDAIWRLEPIIPTEKQMRLIDAYFSIYNPILTVVDEDSFRASLKSAGRIDAHQRDPSLQSSMSDMFSNAEGYGFRVLFFTLLTVASRTSLDSPPADAKSVQHGPISSTSAYYFNLAKRYLGPCFTAPTKHLISSLLLMTLITRTWMRTHEAYLHAEVAFRLLPMVKDATPNLIAATKILVASNNAFHLREVNGENSEGTCPHLKLLVLPKTESEKVSPHDRFGDIVSFLMAFLINDCEGSRVLTEQEVDPNAASSATNSSPVRVKFCVTALSMIINEAESIQKQHNLFPCFPFQILLFGCKAIMRNKLGNVDGALSDIITCIDLINENRFARYCFPVILMVVRFMPVLKSALKLDGSSEISLEGIASAEDETAEDAKIRQTVIDACKFLRASRTVSALSDPSFSKEEKRPPAENQSENSSSDSSGPRINESSDNSLKKKRKRSSQSKEEMQGFGMSMASMTAAIAPKVQRKDHLLNGVSNRTPIPFASEPLLQDVPVIHDLPKEFSDAEPQIGNSSPPFSRLEFPSPFLSYPSSNDPTSASLSLLFQETFGDDLFEEFERDALALADSSSHDDSSPVSGGESGKSSKSLTASSHEASEDFDKIFPSMDDVELFVK
jgi:Fungal Zn(2)-Cys(6) binuclear cluster domain